MYPADCLGVQIKTKAHFPSNNVTEGCTFGTKGALCSICIEGYSRDKSTCKICYSDTVPIRVCTLISVVLGLFFIVYQCRRKIKRQWKKYRPIWKDVLRVASINITFFQINSSLPFVIKGPWPELWNEFVRSFAFVNIDLMRIIGANCITENSYYVSFGVMVCLPISILIFSLLHYKCSVRQSPRHKLRKMSEVLEEMKNMEIEAFQMLFHMADKDHSQAIDASELVNILQQLGWKISMETGLMLVEVHGGKPDEHGAPQLTEMQFLEAMVSGSLNCMLDDIDGNTSSIRVLGPSLQKIHGKWTISSKRQAAHKLAKKRGMLTDGKQLVKWIRQKNIVANSLSGATQLLLLAHTPVSRKVFQFFHCNELAGRRLLRADYSIDCTSDEYFAFMPVILIVLATYIIALPGSILIYLWWNRMDLYSTMVFQKMGWLYESYVRGAEFWHVHDVIVKMILTGMLIYVPPASRAGIAVLVCAISIANLNYFRPHKSKILFWLSQLSFLTTMTKYVVALLLSASLNDDSETQTVGVLLVTLDIIFMSLSLCAIVLSVVLLRQRLREIQQLKKDEKKQRQTIIKSKSKTENQGTISSSNSSSSCSSNERKTVVKPTDKKAKTHAAFIKRVDAARAKKAAALATNFSTSSIPTSSATTPSPAKWALEKTNSTRQQASIVHQQFLVDEANLKRIQDARAKKAHLHTQSRVAARLKVRQTKTLTNVAMFAQLNPAQIEIVCSKMSFEKRLKGDVICAQGDDARRFYIIVTGRCDISMTNDDGSYRKITVLGSLEYFGESSLIGANSKRNASVTVASDSASILHLEKSVFEDLLRSHVIDNAAIEHARELADARANVRYSQALQNVALFRDLPDESMTKIIEAMEVRTYKRTEQLVLQGEDAFEFMVILQGTVSVVVNGKEVRTFHRLNVLGEAALVEQDPKRGATVTATNDVQVLVLSRNCYDELLADGSITKKTHARAKRMSMAYSAADALALQSAILGLNSNDDVMSVDTDTDTDTDTESDSNLNSVDSYPTALYQACEKGDSSVVQNLLASKHVNVNQAEPENGCTPLYIACQCNHVEIVQQLLQRTDLLVNQPDNDGFTPLFIACQYNQKSIVNELLSNEKINVNQHEDRNGGASPLVISAYMGHVYCVAQLLQHCDIDTGLLFQQQTALDWAQPNTRAEGWDFLTAEINVEGRKEAVKLLEGNSRDIDSSVAVDVREKKSIN